MTGSVPVDNCSIYAEAGVSIVIDLAAKFRRLLIVGERQGLVLVMYVVLTSMIVAFQRVEIMVLKIRTLVGTEKSRFFLH